MLWRVRSLLLLENPQCAHSWPSTMAHSDLLQRWPSLHSIALPNLTEETPNFHQLQALRLLPNYFQFSRVLNETIVTLTPSAVQEMKKPPRQRSKFIHVERILPPQTGAPSDPNDQRLVAAVEDILALISLGSLNHPWLSEKKTLQPVIISPNTDEKGHWIAVSQVGRFIFRFYPRLWNAKKEQGLRLTQFIGAYPQIFRFTNLGSTVFVSLNYNPRTTYNTVEIDGQVDSPEYVAAIYATLQTYCEVARLRSVVTDEMESPVEKSNVGDDSGTPSSPPTPPASSLERGFPSSEVPSVTKFVEQPVNSASPRVGFHIDPYFGGIMSFVLFFNCD